MPSKSTVKAVQRTTALHALASLYPETHRMHIGDQDLDDLFLRAAEEISEHRRRAAQAKHQQKEPQETREERTTDALRAVHPGGPRDR